MYSMLPCPGGVCKGVGAHIQPNAKGGFAVCVSVGVFPWSGLQVSLNAATAVELKPRYVVHRRLATGQRVFSTTTNGITYICFRVGRADAPPTRVGCVFCYLRKGSTDRDDSVCVCVYVCVYVHVFMCNPSDRCRGSEQISKFPTGRISYLCVLF